MPERNLCIRALTNNKLRNSPCKACKIIVTYDDQVSPKAISHIFAMTINGKQSNYKRRIQISVQPVTQLI